VRRLRAVVRLSVIVDSQPAPTARLTASSSTRAYSSVVVICRFSTYLGC
jgi:hypothetical protein